jgi:hypothetical protein
MEILMIRMLMVLALSQAGKIIDAIKPQLEAMRADLLKKAMNGRQPGVDEQQVIDEFKANTTRMRVNAPATPSFPRTRESMQA